MTTHTTSSRKSIDYGDWGITLVLLGVMIGAYVLTWKWPAGTAFFPELLSLAGICFLAVKICSLVWTAFGGGRAAETPAVQKAHSNGEVSLVAEGDEDQGNESEFHDVFTQSDGRTWLGAIGWIALFFVGMYLFGLLVILPIFTLIYLRLVAKASWFVCVLYVLGTAGLIYVVFEMFLHLPLPQGIFPITGD